jgi:hypothetical protein
MRYQNVEDVTFTTIDGEDIIIKGRREIPEYQTMTTAQKVNGELMDEIITRPELYGEGNEDLAYLIFEANQKEIIEADFNLNKLTEVKIPLLE